jgi:colicin import membrane protein
MKKIIKWFGILFIAFIIFLVLVGPSDEVTETESDNRLNTVEESTSEGEEVQDIQEEVNNSTQSDNGASESDEATVSQRNAVRAAENYLRVGPFSESGLIKQLEFEGYSTEDATYAVQNIDVDYNEQAQKSAENYLEISPFSRDGLIQQLEFEGYTSAQAEFGVNSVGL